MTEVREDAEAATGCVLQAGEEHGDGIPIREHAIAGLSARAIREFVKGNDTDLVVMRSHGRVGTLAGHPRERHRETAAPDIPAGS